MEDKSFLEFTDDNILEKMDIDIRLVEPFKRVMEKIQVYFNANGYTDQRNYKEFLEKHLLAEDIKEKIKFQVNDEPKKIGANGFYQNNNKIGKESIICIDETIIDENYVDSVLCHEVIHFLVMNDLEKGECEEEIRIGGFINEALTEMLNQQIYPKSKAYEPQVNMLEFANKISGNVNNYQKFLKGSIDSRGSGSNWPKFIESVNNYQNKFVDTGFKMKDAINNVDYINAQRQTIETFISSHNIKNIDEYLNKTEILDSRPVEDKEYIDNFTTRMDNSFVSSMQISDVNSKEFLLDNLSKLRETNRDLNKYESKDIYEFKLEGFTIAVGKDMKYSSDKPLVGFQVETSPRDGKIVFKSTRDKDASVTIDVNAIDFEKRNKDLIINKNNFKNYFSNNTKRDIGAVNEISKNGENLVKLEKYIVPAIGIGKKATKEVYIAQYDDRIEVLESLSPIGVVSNVKLNKYIGVTSKENGLIYSNYIRNVEQGYKFSTLSEKQIQSKSIAILDKELTDIKDEQEISQIIEQYKKSEEYYGEVDDKELRSVAMHSYAKDKFLSMEVDEQQKLYNQVFKDNEQFVVSTNNGEIEVSNILGDEKCMFKSKCVTLVDNKESGIYNELFQKFQKEKTNENVITQNKSLYLNEKGEILIPELDLNVEKDNENKEPPKEKSRNSFSDDLGQYVKKINEQTEAELENGTFGTRDNNNKKEEYRVEKSDDDFVM